MPEDWCNSCITKIVSIATTELVLTKVIAEMWEHIKQSLTGEDTQAVGFEIREQNCSGTEAKLKLGQDFQSLLHFVAFHCQPVCSAVWMIVVTVTVQPPTTPGLQ